MTKTTDEIIAKIIKLLALGERGGTEAEAFAAMSKAQELLAKHNLSMDDVKDPSITQEDYTKDLTPGTANNPWQGIIYMALAKLYFCKSYYVPGRRFNDGMSRHGLLGKPSNIAIVKYIAQYAINTANLMAENAYNTYYPEGSKRGYTTSFKKGFANRVATRCNEQIKRAMENTIKDSGTGTALILHPLYTKASQELQDYQKHIGLKLIAGHANAGASNTSAYQRGKDAANSISLTPNGLGNNKQTCIG